MARPISLHDCFDPGKTCSCHADMKLCLQEIAAVKDDAERDLAAAKPALDAAVSALNSISPKDINSLKALKNPPDVVKRIFDAVLLLRCGSLW